MRLAALWLVASVVASSACASTTTNHLNSGTGGGGGSQNPDPGGQGSGGRTAASGGSDANPAAGSGTSGGSSSGGAGSGSGQTLGGSDGTSGRPASSGGRNGGGAGRAATGGQSSGGRTSANGGGAGRAAMGGQSSGGRTSANGGRSSASGGQTAAGASALGGSTGTGGSTQMTGPLSVGANSMTFTFTYSGSKKLDSHAIDTVSGSTLLTVVAMGALANMHAPQDNFGNTYRSLLAAHNYENWAASGTQLFAATNITGGSGHVVTETMPDKDDEVTLSVIEIRGAQRVGAVTVSETPSKGPVTSASVTTKGPAILVAWWWGDGGLTQISATTSAGWTRVHSLGRAQGDTGLVQTELAARAVDAAGTYSVTWTSNPDQGAVVYLVSIE